MNCGYPKDNISAYIDGELSQKDRTLAEDHIGSCEECALYLKELRNTVSTVKTVEEAEPPTWLTQKVMAKVREEVDEEKGLLHKLFFPLHIKLPLEAFATIAVAITALFIFKAVKPEIERTRIPSEMLQQETEVMKDSTDEIAPLSSAPAGAVQEEQRKAAPAFMKEESAEPLDDVYRSDEEKAEDVSDAAKLKRSFKAVTEDAEFVLRVKDMPSAREEMLKAVAGVKGELLRTESFFNKDIFLVKADSVKIGELSDKLRHIGEIEYKKMPSVEAPDDIYIRIEVTAHP